MRSCAAIDGRGTMRSMGIRGIWSLAAVLVLAGTGGHAWAQDVTEPVAVPVPEPTLADPTPETTAAAAEDTASAEEMEGFGDFADLDLAALLNADVGSASARVQTIADAPAIIEVISREQIRLWGASTLDDILNMVIGVQIKSDYFGFSQYQFRGPPARDNWDNRILMLIDGHPLFEVGNGGMIHDQVPVNAIERIEVIRGPGGVMFGTNAVLGVINIITRTPEKSFGEVMGAFGYGNGLGGQNDNFTWEGRGAGGYKVDKGFIEAYVQYYRSPRWRGYAPETATLDAAGNPRSHEFTRAVTTVSSTLRTRWSLGANQLEFQAGFLHNQKLIWGVQPVAGLPTSERDMYSFYSFVKHERTWEKLSLATRVGFDSNYQIMPSGMFPFPEDPNFEFGGRTGTDRTVFYDVDTSKLEVDIRGSYDFGQVLWTVGANQSAHIYRSYQLRFADTPEGEPGPLAPTLPRLNYDKPAFDSNLMTEVNYTPTEKLSLYGGLRGAMYIAPQIRPDLPAPPVSITPNPRAAAIVRINERSTLKFLYGRAFRLPTLFEMFGDALGIIMSNTELKPETVDSGEVGYDLRPIESVSLRASAYVNRVRDEIINFRSPGNNAGAVLHVNSDGSLYYGGELAARYVCDFCDLRAAVGYVNGIDDWTLGGDKSKPNDHLADWTAVASTTFYAVSKKFSVTPMYRLIGPRYEFGAAHVLDGTMFYQVIDPLRLGMVVKNVTDIAYEDVARSEGSAPKGVIHNQPFTASLWVEATF